MVRIQPPVELRTGIVWRDDQAVFFVFLPTHSESSHLHLFGILPEFLIGFAMTPLHPAAEGFQTPTASVALSAARLPTSTSSTARSFASYKPYICAGQFTLVLLRRLTLRWLSKPNEPMIRIDVNAVLEHNATPFSTEQYLTRLMNSQTICQESSLGL